MTRIQIGILSAIAILCVAAVVGLVRQSKENQLLEQQVAVAQLTADNQRLSNLLAQSRTVQVNSRVQQEELLKLKAEFNRFRQEHEATNQILQGQLVEQLTNQVRDLSTLRTELSSLSDDVSNLRDAVMDIYSGGTGTVPQQAASTTPNTSNEDRTLAIRMIETRGEPFAEKLKSSTGATDSETFPEVFGRYLRSNGVNLTDVAAMAYDERTGRIIVRAPRSTLDTIERLTASLDRAP